MSSHDGPNIVTDDIIYLVDAINKKSYPGTGTTLTDMISRQTVTMTNVTFSNARNFTFDGANSIIQYSAGFLSNIWAGGATLSIWCRPDSAGEGGSGRVAEKSGGGANGWTVLLFDLSSGDLRIRLQHNTDATDGVWDGTNRDVVVGEWHNIVITYDKDSTSNDPIIYINATPIELSETTPTGNFDDDSSLDLTFGNREGQSRTFNGLFDYVAVWNRELTAAEVLANFNALRGRFDL